MATLNSVIQTSQQDGLMLDAQKILTILQQNVAESGSNQTITQLLGLPANLTQMQIANDTSPLWFGANPLLTSGTCYTLIGDIVMWMWMHNTSLTNAGAFTGSYDSGACSLYVITEGNSSTSTGATIKTYFSPTAAAGTVPTFVLTSNVDTGLGKQIVSTASLTSYTLAAAQTYFTGSAGASMAITFPAASAAIDCLCMTVFSTNSRTSATWISSGASFVGAPATMAAATPYKFQYDQSTTSWYLTS